MKITLIAFGDCEGRRCWLIEDDEETVNTGYRQFEYTLKDVPAKSGRYHIIGSSQIN